MRAYWSIVRMRFIALLQYRAAAAAGVFTQLFFGFVMIYVMREFFFSSPGDQPLTLPQMVAYVWLGQAMLAMMPWSGDAEVIDMIKSGNISYELCRPLELYNHWYCRLVALRTAPTILKSVPIFAVTLLLPGDFGLRPPPTLSSLAAWLIAILGSLLLGCAMSNIITICTLWTIAGDGMNRLMPALVIMLSGSIVPLPFFPDWMQGTLRFLPFSGLVDAPNQFFIGSMPPGQVWMMLTHQLLWTVVFVLTGRTLVALATRRVVIQGG